MKPEQKIIDQCISLAAITQSIRAVQQIAWRGRTSESDLKTVVMSLLKNETASAVAIYNASFELNTGLRFLGQQLDPDFKEKDPEFFHLVMSLLVLVSKFQKNAALMKTLTQKIDLLANDYKDKNFDEDNTYNEEKLFEKLLEQASLTYQATLSKLPKRLHVKGEPSYLKQETNQIQIRAALLAAVRAVFLWRQMGGSRWDFVIRKKQLLSGIRYLISNPVKN